MAPPCPAAAVAPVCPTVPPAFLAALAATSRPAAGSSARDLVELRPSDPGLSWRGGRVLMVSWKDPECFRRYRPGETFALPADTFFTAHPEVREACRGFPPGTDLEDRLQQFLGLPPRLEERAFLAVWVDPAAIFRPCAPGEIADGVCRFEGVAGGARAAASDPAPPWACPDRPRSRRRLRPDRDGRAWLCGRWRQSHDPSRPACDRYPFTGLGYTWDWGAAGDPRGASEFVVFAGTPVVFAALVPTGAYCREAGSGPDTSANRGIIEP
jgi:hypothetical protein